MELNGLQRNMQPTPIVPLSNAVISRIRSSSQVCSLSHAVEEVVANSIDAESTCIAVTVDLQENSFTVKDNGCGIQPSSMAHVCKRHHTNKSRVSTNDVPVKLGYRGESLASIADLAVVHVTSRGLGCFETMTKVVRGGSVLKCGVSLKARMQSGTTVAVRNFMYNRPVRQRQAFRTRSHHCKELATIRDALFRMLLPATHVELMLYAERDSEPVLHLVEGRTKNSSLQYIFNSDHESLVRLSKVSKAMVVEGSILLPPSGHHSREKQYFYVNGRPMHCKTVSDVIEDLHKCVCDDLDRAGGWTVEGSAGCQYPGYVLSVSCSRCMYEVSYELNRATAVFLDTSEISHLIQDAVIVGWQSVLSETLIQKLKQRDRKIRYKVGSKKKVFAIRGDEGMDSNAKATVEQRRTSTKDWMGNASGIDIHSNKENNVRGGNAMLGCSRRASLVAPALSSRRSSLGAVNGGNFVANMQKNVKMQEKDEIHGGREQRCRFDSLNMGSFMDLGDMGVDSMKEGQHRECQADWDHTDFSAVFHEVDDIGDVMLESGNSKRKLREWDDVRDMHEWKKWAFPLSREMVDDGVGRQYGHESWHGSLESDFDVRANRGKSANSWSKCSNHELPHWKGSKSISYADPGHISEGWDHLLSTKPSEESEWDLGVRKDSVWEMPPFPDADQDIVNSFGCHERWQSERNGEVHMIKMQSSMPCTNEDKGQILDNCLLVTGGHASGSVCWDQKDGPQENPCAQLSPALEPNKQMGTKCRPNRRAMSAPPHPRKCYKGFHSNPVMSLKTQHPGRQIKGSNNSYPSTSQRGTFRGVQSVLDPGACIACLPKERGRNPSADVTKNVLDGTVASSGMLNASKKGCKGNGTMGRPSSNKRVRFKDRDGKISLSGRSACKMKSALQPDTDVKVAWQRNGSRIHDATSKRVLNLNALLDEFSNPPLVALNEERIKSITQFASLHSLVPQSISRDVFEQARVLRQVDKKFVLMVCGDAVVAVDQHAADERVQLEALQKTLVSMGHESGMILAEELDASLVVHLTHLEQQLFEMHKSKVEHWGWKGKLDLQSGNLILTHQPLLFGSPMNSTELKIYLNHLENTGGSDILPPCVLRVLKSKACRSAMMFGDALSFSKCCDLISNLRETQFCFSCAHGRPTMVPLADVPSLQTAIEKEKPGLDVLDVPKQNVSLKLLSQNL